MGTLGLVLFVSVSVGSALIFIVSGCPLGLELASSCVFKLLSCSIESFISVLFDFSV